MDLKHLKAWDVLTMYLPAENHSARFKIHSGSSIFTAEMHAIGQALKYILQHSKAPKYIIFSDSMPVSKL